MTTKAYSNDIRIKVIKHMELGHNQTSTAHLFSIGRNTVSRWWKRYKEEGVFTSKPRGGSKGKINLFQLEEYVNLNPNKTLKEIGKEFGISDCAVHKRLTQLGFKYKKKTLNIGKETKKRERPMENS